MSPIEFLLSSLLDSIREAALSDQVSRLLHIAEKGEMSASDWMKELGLSHRPTFRKNYLEPALAQGFIERNRPESPRSPTQKYRLTDKGKAVLSRKRAKKKNL